MMGARVWGLLQSQKFVGLVSHLGTLAAALNLIPNSSGQQAENSGRISVLQSEAQLLLLPETYLCS